ncbi:MAG: TfoX/Sxy family DNA transformation protein [Planctomycetes bacterium]|nr:TfoX/Sxy family DNA transformation protein [Planctomycetota bacterium]
MPPRDFDDFTEDVLERLQRVAPTHAKRMFGGVGLYVDGVFCALIADGRLYFKVDDTNRGDFERAGTEPFQPFPDKPTTMGYYAVPERVLGDRARLELWLTKAVDVAKRATTKKPKARRAPSAARVATPIAKLENLGPKSAEWLAAVGVQTLAELERIGSVRAFARVRDAGFAPSLNLLWALEATLVGARWNRLSDEVKRELAARAGEKWPRRSR